MKNKIYYRSLTLFCIGIFSVTGLMVALNDSELLGRADGKPSSTTGSDTLAADCAALGARNSARGFVTALQPVIGKRGAAEPGCTINMGFGSCKSRQIAVKSALKVKDQQLEASLFEVCQTAAMAHSNSMLVDVSLASDGQAETIRLITPMAVALERL